MRAISQTQFELASRSLESAGDPGAVDPFAACGGGGFACPASTGGAAGSATVVCGAALAAGVAALGFRSRVEICEKPPAASLAPGGATSAARVCEGMARFERATSMVAAMVLNLALLVAPRRDLRVPGFGAVRP